MHHNAHSSTLFGHRTYDILNLFVLSQVFLIDNLDLGVCNKLHNVLPRIADFDPESFRRMLTMAADPIKGTTSYSHANVTLISVITFWLLVPFATMDWFYTNTALFLRPFHSCEMHRQFVIRGRSFRIQLRPRQAPIGFQGIVEPRWRDT